MPHTAVDRLADAHLDRLLARSPITATELGVDQGQDRWDDFSPAGIAAATDDLTDTLKQASRLQPEHTEDRITLAILRERLTAERDLYEAGEYRAEVNNISCPLQTIRNTFDLMPTQTRQDWHNIAARMAAVPQAIDGYLASLREGIASGLVPARRQVHLATQQADELAGEDSFFTTLAASAGEHRRTLGTELDQGADLARSGYRALAQFLAEELADHASATDPVGEQRYLRWSRYFLGAQIDQRETYAWGLEQFRELTERQLQVAATICGPGASIEEAISALDADPTRKLPDTAALQAWMQNCADQAIAALNGTHFDIPEPVRRIECRIAPTHSGEIYYTGPSEDFSRPGRMWWSVPEGVQEFGTWRERTTVHHEGVPGHHLQIAQTVYRSEELNRWRRLGVWVSGHGEGWALYAERLMEEFGFLSDPGDLMGMLDAQRMRAARVIVDIGVHLGLDCPQQWGGGRWDADKAWEFLRRNVAMDEAFIRFELDRYLGWPGQAPSYLVGQRLWLELREQAAQRAHDAGEPFDLTAFHRRALDLGPMGLDTLRWAMTEA